MKYTEKQLGEEMDHSSGEDANEREGDGRRVGIGCGKSSHTKKIGSCRDVKGPLRSKEEKRMSPEKQSSQQPGEEQKRGRPEKFELDRQHSEISRKFNDIIYHYARFLIFLHLMKEKDAQNYALTLNNLQSSWLSEATHIMSLDNFPPLQQRTSPFLLHPNSLHYIIEHNKSNNKVLDYDSQKIKYFFFAFLMKRNLLTQAISAFVSRYWPDIVYLINSHKNNSARGRGNFGTRQLYIQREEDDEGRGRGTRGEMQDELKQDNTIAAYEIACYLKSCCELYSISIKAGSRQS